MDNSRTDFIYNLSIYLLFRRITAGLTLSITFLSIYNLYIYL